MTQNTPLSRRALLGGIVGTTIAGLSGCTSGNNDDGSDPSAAGFETITVEGTELVVELVDDHPIERLSIVEPTGEQFAAQGVPTGVTRQTFSLGTSYRPGEYEIIGLTEDEEVYSSTSIEIEPDVAITDLRLGLNHPEEMEGKHSGRGVDWEVIVQIENTGMGPESIHQLAFSGNVPRPTREDRQESGILDTESPITDDADKIVVPPEEEMTIFSNSMPFNRGGEDSVCAATISGDPFEVRLGTEIADDAVTRSFDLVHLDEDTPDCVVEVQK